MFRRCRNILFFVAPSSLTTDSYSYSYISSLHHFRYGVDPVNQIRCVASWAIDGWHSSSHQDQRVTSGSPSLFLQGLVDVIRLFSFSRGLDAHGAQAHP